MPDMNFASKSPCRYQPPKGSDGGTFLLDLARTVIGVAAGTLIALAIARAYVTWEIKEGIKDIDRRVSRPD